MKQTAACNLLASAYLSSACAPQSLKTIKHLCYSGVALGSFALMLALIITSGFERDISIKMKGISSDAVIESPGNQLAERELTSYIRDHEGAAIKGISASSTRHIIFSHGETSRVLFLRAINGKDEAKTTALQDKLIVPHHAELDELLARTGSIIIGTQCAAQNNLWLGSDLTMYVPEQAAKSKIALEKKVMHLAGIFKLGIEDYDLNVAYCSYETFRSLYPHATGADQLAISFHSTDQEDAIKRLRTLLPELSIRSWKELYPDLVASLELEKYAISIVLALIGLVASMLVVCLLFMFTHYKRQDIAILQAIGMSQASIQSLFVRIGMTIVIRAAVCGIATACLVGWFIETYRPIRLPDIYYIAYLPAAVDPWHAVIVALLTGALGYAACRFPLGRLNDISLARILRGA